jgi:hypothetical protein
MKVSQSLDMIVSCLLFSLCLSVLLGAATLITLMVLGEQLLRTSKLKRNKTFAEVRWMLTIIWIAPECWDTTVLARLCRGTWLMRILTRKKGTRKGH